MIGLLDSCKQYQTQAEKIGRPHTPTLNKSGTESAVSKNEEIEKKTFVREAKPGFCLHRTPLTIYRLKPLSFRMS